MSPVSVTDPGKTYCTSYTCRLNLATKLKSRTDTEKQFEALLV
jgi:hypothetical protein